MGKDYEIRKESDGGPSVVYRCSACGRQIESLLSDAGCGDNCPTCGNAVVVPGEAEWQLIREAEGKPDSASKFVVGWIFHTAVEAQLGKDALDEAGVRYLAEDFLKNPYDGAFATQFGWGRILVREDDVQRAKEVIQEALEPCPLADAEEEPEGDEETETDTPSAP